METWQNTKVKNNDGVNWVEFCYDSFSLPDNVDQGIQFRCSKNTPEYFFSHPLVRCTNKPVLWWVGPPGPSNKQDRFAVIWSIATDNNLMFCHFYRPLTFGLSVCALWNTGVFVLDIFDERSGLRHNTTVIHFTVRTNLQTLVYKIFAPIVDQERLFFI